MSSGAGHPSFFPFNLSDVLLVSGGMGSAGGEEIGKLTLNGKSVILSEKTLSAYLGYLW